MRCTRCGSSNTRVLDSRLIENETKIRRRRECLNCKLRFTTFETYETEPVYVLKSSGKREEFNRDKLFKSIKLCFAKRIEDEVVIDEIIKNIQKNLERRGIYEIKSDVLGQMVMEELKKIDPVSCVIYACNICDLRSIEEVENLIKYIKN